MSGVSVWEAVDRRGASITECEAWAILAASATTLQDNALTDEGRIEVVTPEGVVLRRCGRVDLLATPPDSPVHPHGNYLPPEAFTEDPAQEGERLLVFSLGRTLWTAAEHAVTNSSNRRKTSCTHQACATRTISSGLRSTLSAMTHSLPTHRLSLVDIFQLLVERLDSQDRLNYTAIIRSLYEEVLGPPPPPPLPPDPVVVRERSYSALDARTSSSRKATPSWSPSQRSTSVEDLSHQQQSFGPMKPALMCSTPFANTFHTQQDRGVIRMASMQDVSVPASLRKSNRMADDTVLNENIHKNLLRSKMNFHSMDTLSSVKENIMPRSIDGNVYSSMGSIMNPILEVPSTQTSPVKTYSRSNLLHNVLPHKESRTSVTVSRSATVAGDMKGQGQEARNGDRPCLQKRTPPKKPPRSRAMSVDNLLNTETELRQNLCEVIPKKRRMVVRTPSRLYRFADFDPATVVGHTSAGLPPILGPEFVVRSKEPVKVLTLLQDAQQGVVKKVTVVLLTGKRLELTCDPATTRVIHVIQAVFREENIPLQNMLGLAVLGSGEFHFVAPKTKLHKVAPPGWKEKHPTKDGLMQDNFTLHLRIMYYLRFGNVGEMEDSSRQLLYLQLRHDLLEGHLALPSDVLLHLATLALQAEFGDQKEQGVSYFLPEHYVPESLLRGGQSGQVSRTLQQNHAALAGLHHAKAQTRFITTLQDTQHYGAHYYHVTQDKGRQQWRLGIGLDGVLVLGSGPLTSESVAQATLHPWPSVKRLSYTTHRLTVAVRGPAKSTKIKFHLQENRSRHVFYLATVHQSFHYDAAVLNHPSLPVGGSGIPLEVIPTQQDLQSRAPSSTSSATTTARTSLSSADAADELVSGGQVIEAPGGSGDHHGTQSDHNECTKVSLALGAERTDVSTSLWPVVSGGPKSSDSLSREKFLSDILWRGGGDEVDEVFSIENLENEQQSHQRQQQEASGDIKFSVPRVFHQRSKSNIESSSKGGSGTTRPELTREFGSDESLLASPKKGGGVRMGTRVSAAALQKRRLLRSTEGLYHHHHHHHLPSLHELNTTPTAVVLEPSLRSLVVEEESVNDSLVERFLQCPTAGCERRLHTVTLAKVRGSLGVMIAQGADHGLYIQAVSPGGPAALEGSLRPGQARLRPVGGLTFSREVRSGPVTVITVNTSTPSCDLTPAPPPPLRPPTPAVPATAPPPASAPPLKKN
ncbi:uncharacterized protein [Panulirus ornatus]|uniref:uncharacterized protein isoform X2 n=1 Tax=Panulirus ornatus TaxID=150431 RepID=UPI003A882781